MISRVWVVFFVLSLVCGILTGRLDEVTAAAVIGAKEAVTLLISITGLMCFWSGIMELVRASELSKIIANFLKPVLRPLFGEAAKDQEAMEGVSANVTANLLGLNNAATPIGLCAADRLYTVCGRKGAPDALLTLITLNTTSVQVIPSTVAAIRQSYGASQPFDIMPAVWGASIASVIVVIFAGRLMRRVFPDDRE